METPSPDFLRSFLAGRDVACPGCGYNLRDLAGSRCPECGDELVLRVGLAEPRQAAAITGLVGLAAGAGFSGLLLIYVLIWFVLSRNLGGPPAPFYATTAVGFIVEGLGAYLWVGYWRSVCRLPTRGRWVLVAGCWFLTLVNLVVFTWAVR